MLSVPVVEILAVGGVAFEGAGEATDVPRVVDGVGGLGGVADTAGAQGHPGGAWGTINKESKDVYTKI